MTRFTTGPELLAADGESFDGTVGRSLWPDGEGCYRGHVAHQSARAWPAAANRGHVRPFEPTRCRRDPHIVGGWRSTQGLPRPRWRSWRRSLMSSELVAHGPVSARWWTR